MERDPKRVEEELANDEQAKKEIWKYILGFAEMAVVKCAVELKIADAIEANGNPMTISELASTLSCSAPHLRRIMRFLVHRRIFKETPSTTSPAYSQTPLSRLLMRSGQSSMASFILLESLPPMLAPWHGLSSRVQGRGDSSSAFESANGEDFWSYAAANPAVNQLINDAMACNARLNVEAIVGKCKDLFHGVETVVDVGGGNGTTLGMLVKAFPWIRGINFDLPHVISDAKEFEGVENVGGDMFDSVPSADAVFIMSVLHDWGDEECIKVLKKCKEAIPEDKGKVIIVDAVIENDKKDKDGLSDARLRLDIAMMAHTITGRERTLKEWEYILVQAGFNRHIVRSIDVVPSVIEAFPYIEISG